MKLVITEKPSVAKSISAVLGADKRRDGYFEGENFLISWCFGHLAELASAEVYDEAYARWSREQLPIIPKSWQYSVGRDKKKQLDLLTELMRRSDVTEIINACDAGREGELIFRTVYLLAGCVKPVKRLWISSMEDAAIREGFENLRDGSEYDHLYDAALCRSKADWLVGINATRLFSVLYHRTLNVGRVVSPTLALLVQREAEIKAFQPEPFYTVKLDNGDFAAVSEKLKSKPDVESLKSACAGAPAVIRSVEQKEKSEKAPALYDLTTLQRDANRILGFTAQQTLDYLQSLYEKKLCMQTLRGKHLAEFIDAYNAEFATDINVGHKIRNLTVFDFRSFLNIGMLLSESERAKNLRQLMLDIVIDLINRKTGGGTKYINQRDKDFLFSSLQEDNYRRQFTDALKECVVADRYKYAHFTDLIYVSIFKEKAKEYKKILDLKATDKVRDTFYSEILDIVAAYESGLAEALRQECEKIGRPLTIDEAEALFHSFEEMALWKPLIQRGRVKMASRDLALRDAFHYQLSEYIQPLDKDEYQRFLGAAGDELERLMAENQEVLRRLKERE